MPVWLTWKLFWKVAPYIGAILLLIGAVWYIDHRGFERAEAQATARENERKQLLAEFNRVMAEKTKNLEGSMQTAITQSDAMVVKALTGLDITNKTIIQPTLMKEIQSETRFTDPAAGLTVGMQESLNRARGFSKQRPCPAGSHAVACYSLPGVESPAGQVVSNPDS
jgi:hypothetical protein